VSTTVTTRPTGTSPPQPVEVSPVTQRRVLRSEWIKFWTVRSSVLVLALTVVLMIVIGLLVSYFTNTNWNHLRPGERIPGHLIRRSLIGVNLAQLTVGVLGVVVISGEYSTGLIRATLGAVPTRLPVLWAKAAVLAVVGFFVVLVSALIAYVGGQALLGSHGLSLGYPGSVRAVFGVALYVTVVGILGLALGFLIRSTAGGIAVLVAVLLVLPGIAAALPTSWQNTIVPYLPSSAGQAVFVTGPRDQTLHPWPGFALFCGYTAVTVIVAAVALRRRDA
jgi:ABC-2 type transport system permease protein